MSAATPVVLLAGNPNSGKTSIYNRLTGSRAKVSNYPGVTVERRVGVLARADGPRIELVDLPGTYSLTARSAEERVAVDALLGRAGAPPDAVVVVADATALGRGLYLATQLVDAGKPVVLALNMIDEARAAGLVIDAERLAAALSCTVVETVATQDVGLDSLAQAVRRVLDSGPPSRPCLPTLPAPLADDVAAVEQAVRAAGLARDAVEARTWATWALLSLGDDEVEVPASVRDAASSVRGRAQAAGRDLDEELVAWRYRRVDEVLDGALRTASGPPKRSPSERADAVLVHPVWGFVVFAVVMALVFQALFAWSEPLVAAVEAGIGALKGAATAVLPEGALRDLLTEGVIGGVGNVVVFVPQIAILFAFITVLEDSGYLARVAFVIDRIMGGVGLHGRAFVPMLSGFACAVPAVLATRTLESRRDRLLTMLVVPLTSCSARLPVYVLVTAVVFEAERKVFGLLSIGALVLFAMYALSTAAALGAAAVLRRSALRGPRPTLVLELPPYRMPTLRDVGLATWLRVRRFLTDAGTVILALSIVLWGLLSYPKDGAAEARWEARRAEITAAIPEGPPREEALAQASEAQQGEALRYSVGGRVGQALRPALEPLGLDWRVGIGIVGAFAAREVFVSTLGIVFDVGEADEESQPLRDALRGAEHADGSKLMTPLAGLSLMVFFVLACQCMSTVAAVRRESGSWKWAGFLFAYMTALAYVAALGVYQVGRWLGWGIT